MRRRFVLDHVFARGVPSIVGDRVLVSELRTRGIRIPDHPNESYHFKTAMG